MWRRLEEGEAAAVKRRRPINYRRPDFMTNAQGQMVRQHAPHPIKSAIERFIAMTERVLIGDDYCVVWQGGETFRVDDDTITTPARFYYESLLGEPLKPNQTLRRACKTPRCVKHKKVQ